MEWHFTRIAMWEEHLSNRNKARRVSSVKIKLNVIPEVVKGKRIVMVDDSIVRGTTCANIIKMLKKAGAKEVHVRISSPPFLHPCFFGTDVPSNEQLIAHTHTQEEIRRADWSRLSWIHGD